MDAPHICGIPWVTDSLGVDPCKGSEERYKFTSIDWYKFQLWAIVDTRTMNSLIFSIENQITTASQISPPFESLPLKGIY